MVDRVMVDKSTQTYDESFLSIFTHEGEGAKQFFRYVTMHSPDFLPPFSATGGLSRCKSYAPWFNIVEEVAPSEITEDTIVNCAGGTSSAHVYWQQRTEEIIRRRNLTTATNRMLRCLI